VCAQMSRQLKLSQQGKTSPLQHQLPQHTQKHTHSVCVTAAGLLNAMNTRPHGNLLVGFSGMMGVQVSLLLVSRTS